MSWGPDQVRARLEGGDPTEVTVGSVSLRESGAHPRQKAGEGRHEIWDRHSAAVAVFRGRRHVLAASLAATNPGDADDDGGRSSTIVASGREDLAQIVVDTSAHCDEDVVVVASEEELKAISEALAGNLTPEGKRDYDVSLDRAHRPGAERIRRSDRRAQELKRGQREAEEERWRQGEADPEQQQRLERAWRRGEQEQVELKRKQQGLEGERRAFTQEQQKHKPELDDRDRSREELKLGRQRRCRWTGDEG